MRRFLNDLIESVSERGRRLMWRGGASPVRQIVFRQSLTALAQELISGKGEASGVAMAQAILRSYETSSAQERRDFLIHVSENLGPDRQRMDLALAAYSEDGGTAALERLHLASEPRRQDLLRRFNLAPGGTAALVRMREDVLSLLCSEPSLQPLNDDFLHLFGSWFNRGFLVMRRIDWTTPANILEKIIRYEAVHEINGWDDLRRRLEPADRRCFAFFHPQLVDDPLIFVEVALTGDIPAAIKPLLSETRAITPPTDMTTAVFYSISNCQKGLAQISFGNFLIKQVVEDLKAELSQLRRFVTISPVPGFRNWFEQLPVFGEIKQDLEMLQPLRPSGPATFDQVRLGEIRAAVVGAAASYFLNAKSAAKKPIDPVARFHLGNGARLERINWMGDQSAKGWRQSFGLMVNYVYDLDDITTNHEMFANDGTIVASSAIHEQAGRMPAMAF